MRTFLNLCRRYPGQVGLFLFNTGVFAWLQTTGLLIANKLGFSAMSSQSLLGPIPQWLRVLADSSVGRLQTIFGSTAISWLIFSMIVTLVIRFGKGLVKLVIVIMLIAIGIYLVWQNQSILSQFNW